MSAKVTPWFPADVKPVYIGWYETFRMDSGKEGKYPWRAFWDGFKWCWEEDDSYSCCSVQSRIWRGLADKP